MDYYSLLRYVLFRMPPEVAHRFTLRSLNALAKAHLWKRPPESKKKVSLLGMNFSNRLGVAAGLDKNGDYFTGLDQLGFGFIELGTVTPFPQLGNAKPRLFRIPKAEALINRLGFNNKGIDHLINQLETRSRPSANIGINIGKNANTSPEHAVSDYVMGLKKAYAFADYITINISSPNTKHLREMQHGDALIELLEKLKQEQQSLAEVTGVYKPLLVKIAPDLGDIDIKWLADQLRYWQIDGVIATNTTIDHSKVIELPNGKEEGGLSGRPLTEKANYVVSVLRQELGEGFPIIGVGGIMSAQDAKERINAGADLLQIYTGLIYKGPGLVKDILRVL